MKFLKGCGGTFYKKSPRTILFSALGRKGNPDVVECIVACADDYFCILTCRARVEKRGQAVAVIKRHGLDLADS